MPYDGDITETVLRCLVDSEPYVTAELGTRYNLGNIVSCACLAE
jgi:hypothetical protein